MRAMVALVILRSGLAGSAASSAEIRGGPLDASQLARYAALRGHAPTSALQR